MTIMIRPVPLLGLLMPVLVLSAQETSPTRLHWQKDDQALALLQNDQVLWRFRYGPEDSKPCFHPLALPDGADLTWFRPDDHRWHRGLWFSWKYINGVNYWEEDPRNGRSAGWTETLRTEVEPRPDHTARLLQELQYRPDRGDPVLREERTIDVTAPEADGSYALEWVSRFVAIRDVVLDRTPLPDEPNGQVYGGYAGLSVRLVQSLEDVVVMTTDERATFKDDRFRGRSPGMDYSGVLEGRPMGIAIVAHPANLNAPSPWYAINGPVMRFFSPAVICYGPQELKSGEELTLRYRVIVHPGRWSSQRLEREASHWVGKP